MALNELINQIVDVQIRNVTSNTYSRDLNTILVLAKHDVFTAPELYRVYQSSSSMAEDGFDLDSYAYNAVRVILSQEITPVNVVVGRVAEYAVNDDYLTTFNQMLMIPQGWLWLISDLRDKATQITLAGLVQANTNRSVISYNTIPLSFSNNRTNNSFDCSSTLCLVR